MICKYCGKETPDNQQICISCGKDLSTKKDYTPIIIVAVLVVVTLVVVGFSIYQQKKAEQRVVDALKGGKPLEETLQETLDDYQEKADEITDEVEQKMEELK